MSFIESKKKRPGSFRHIWPNLGRYRIWTLAAAISVIAPVSSKE